MFNAGLQIGQILQNKDIVDIFKCGNMGGMRRSRKTNTLVIVSDYTKGLYHDKWIDGILHYTGMGKTGDQDIGWAQNKTLAECKYNGIDVHLFEVIDPGEYIYCGRVQLVDQPYIDTQQGEDGNPRKVWIFPIRPVPNNDVRKPPMFVFDNMEDYQTRGKNVDAEYKSMTAKKVKPRNAFQPVDVEIPGKTKITVPNNVIGKQIRHKVYGDGIVIQNDETTIIVDFPDIGEKRLGYEVCTEKKIIEFL